MVKKRTLRPESGVEPDGYTLRALYCLVDTAENGENLKRKGESSVSFFQKREKDTDKQKRLAKCLSGKDHSRKQGLGAFFLPLFSHFDFFFSTEYCKLMICF